MKSLRSILAALALLAAAPAAPAAEFTLFIHESPAELALREDPTPAGQAYWQAYADFGAALEQAGVMRGGAPLDVAAGSSDAVGVAAGPSALVLGGYFVIDVADLDSARAWAARAPAAQRGGRVDIRATRPSPTMR